ncbi:MAG: hypothetical protein PHY76_03270 [Patescibacteria group bacterium]|nr:hypothetical protein [Patescibacteria group bacterium]
MTDKELFNSLKSIKEDIQPDAQWLKANRDSLFAQISNSGGKDLSPWSSFVINFKSILRGVSVPATVLGSLVLFLGAAMTYSHLLFSETQPTNSLYIARELSEQVKLTTMREGKARDQLANKFAATKAQNIVTVLEEDSLNEELRSDLTEKFNKELNTMKEVASRWEEEEEEFKVAALAPVSSSVSEVNEELALSQNGADDVFSANLEKGDDGISLSLAQTSNLQTATNSPTKIIEQAENLFNEKKYKEAGALLGTLMPTKETETESPELPLPDMSTSEEESEVASSSELLP